MKKRVVYLLFFIFLSSYVSSATYYVCDNGADCNAGAGSGWSTGSDSHSTTQAQSKSTPWKTIQKCVNEWVAGDTCIVGDGNYQTAANSYSIVNIAGDSGTSGAWLTLKAENKWGAAIDGSVLGDETYFGIYIEKNSNYIRIEDFEIKNVISAVRPNSHAGPITNLYLYRLKMHDLDFAGYNSGPYADYITIDSCLIYNVRYNENFAVDNIHRWIHNHCLYLMGRHILIINNICYEPKGGMGFRIDGHNDPPLTGSDWSHKIINNVIHGTTEPGAKQSGLINFYKANSDVFYPSYGVVIENNVFINPPDGVSGRKGIQIGLMDNSCTSPSAHWNPGSTRINNNVISGGALLMLSCLSDLVQEYNNNVEVQSADLGLGDPSNHDYTLTESAVHLIDKGTKTNAPSVDIDGNSRDNQPDIGAYEFQSQGNNHYVSPSDSLSAAMSNLQPGDTLVLRDGTYHQGLVVSVSGEPENPITIRAENDGKAIVDGDYIHTPFEIDNKNHITVEGIYFKESDNHVIDIDTADNLIFRRVTASDVASPENNWHVWRLYGVTNSLFEDCAGWGNGRNTVLLYKPSHDVILRRFYMRYHDKQSSHGPACSQIYGAYNNIYENVLCTYDGQGTWGNPTEYYVSGLMIWDNNQASTYSNKIYGSVVWDLDMNTYTAPDFGVSSKSYQMSNNELRDIVSINNFYGLMWANDNSLNVEHATLVNNDYSVILRDNSVNPATDSLTLKNSIISGSSVCGYDYILPPDGGSIVHRYNTWYNSVFCDDNQDNTEINVNPMFDISTYGYGAYLLRPPALFGLGEGGADIGAEVIYQYEDGVLTDEPLWPWPMEDRIKSESGVSVTWEADGGLWKTLDNVYDNVPGGSLANSNTMIADSGNIDPDHPVEHLWDSCLETTPACTTGAGDISSFWVEFDLGEVYKLTRARLFGDAVGNWISRDWSLYYKINQNDVWAMAFTGIDAFFNDWSEQSLGVSARFVKVEVNGNPDIPATQARELEIYGSISGSCGRADSDSNGVVDIDELIIYISEWKIGIVAISELMEGIGFWKSGC